MDRRQASAAVILLLVVAGTAFGNNGSERLSPQAAKEKGFLVDVEAGKNDTLMVTISRDFSKLSDIKPEFRRTAFLSVEGDSGLILECNLGGETEKTVVVYRFTIARKLASHARLTIVENFTRVVSLTWFLNVGDFIAKQKD